MSLLTGLTAYWKFDENAGTTAADATGNGNTATWVGSPVWFPGIIGSGVETAGSSTVQYLTVPSSPTLLFTTGLTISTWANPSLTQSFNPCWIINKQNNWGLDINVNGALFGIYVNPNCSVTSGVTFNHWNHIVATFDQTLGSNNMKLFINGSLAAQATNTNNIPNTSDPVSFGNGLNFSNQAYTGTIDEVGLWNRPLTQAEITQLYNSGVGFQYPFTTIGAGTGMIETNHPNIVMMN